LFTATRARRGGLALFVALACACMAAPAQSAVPSGYSAQALDPTGGTLPGARAGAVVINAGRIDSDSIDDMLMAAPSAQIDSSTTITGRVYVFSGLTGSLIWQATAPSSQPANISGSEPTQFGAAVARLGDIGSCSPLGLGTCNVDPQRDGAPELLVAAPGTDTGGDAGRDQGTVYVLDGATGSTLKSVRLADVERPLSGSAGFGKGLASLAGQPPCAGFGGIGSCLLPADSQVVLGDVDGGGLPDFVVGAPDYTELGGDEYPGCPATVPSCPGVGRVYVVRGELISGSSGAPLAISFSGGTTSFVQFPGQAGGGDPPRFGSALTVAGDLGHCTSGDPTGVTTCLGAPAPLTNATDGRPDFVAAAPGADTGGTQDAGAAFVVDTAGEAAMLRVDSPSPQGGAAFGSFTQSFAAPGKLNADGTTDLVIGAPGQDGQGAAHLLNGDVLGADRQIRTFTDPAPVAGGRFGSSLASFGDVTGDGVAEVAVGAADSARVGAVHVLSACARDVVQTIGDPDPQSGGAFGAAIAPLGDRNGDGMLDLIVGVPGFDAAASADRGRAYLLTSEGAPRPAPVGCGGEATGGDGGGGAEEEVTPTDDDTVVIARVLRRLVLKPSHRRLRRNATLRLRGKLTASSNRSVCQRRQKIALQRRKSSGGRFQTFDVAITRASGKFTARALAQRTYVYRARVSRTARCMGAVSKTAKVSVLRRSGSR
jgi:hypothetical protein